MPVNITKFLILIICFFLITSCDFGANKTPDSDTSLSASIGIQIIKALKKINKDENTLNLPNTPYPVSQQGRLAFVDEALSQPFILIDKVDHIVNKSNIEKQDASTTIKLFLDDFNINYENSEISNVSNTSDASVIQINTYPAAKSLITAISNQATRYEHSKPNISHREFQIIKAELTKKISNTAVSEDNRQIDNPVLHEVGKKFSLSRETNLLLNVLKSVETFINSPHPTLNTKTWNTPLGRIRIAGQENDIHTGDFFILIDLGGDDVYTDVSRDIHNGNLSLVIDLGGNDKINWEHSAGPGTGLLGASIWVDTAGNDTYTGNNLGIGSAIAGTGLLLDYSGDDIYTASGHSMGSSIYGLGVQMDIHGNDTYHSNYASQGFGGNGGIGMLIDINGSDNYYCSSFLPDLDTVRASHTKEQHFVNMCQGYGFGTRPDISGGIGLLFDYTGNDAYKSDIFAQGGAYWYGVGLLVDANGDDQYTAFEHAQGEALHLAAGYLLDFSGNDKYTAYTHSQGTGIDRSIGFLLDIDGNDSYTAHTRSQGTGIKPYGVGLLFDSKGIDHYLSFDMSQGYAKTLSNRYPKKEMPVGILIDKQGDDTFHLDNSKAINGERIQNEQGIALDL